MNNQQTKARQPKSKAKKFVTILSVAKAARVFVPDEDRMRIGKAWYELYLKKRAKEKKRYPWVGHVKEGRHRVRAYSAVFKSEIERFIKLYLELETKDNSAKRRTTK